MTASPDEVGRLLRRWRNGCECALAELMPLVYNDLCRLARTLLRQEIAAHGLPPTALVHELYLRLAGIRAVQWDSRAHFYGFATRSMRQVLIDHARTRRRIKRGQGVLHLPLEEVADQIALDGEGSRAVNQALRDLERSNPRLARVVALRHFVGLTTEETAEACGISPATVKREWQSARSWLQRALAG